MWEYQCQLERVVDGDTVRMLLDHGMYIRSSQAIRLAAVNAAELNQPGGLEAREFVSRWFERHLLSHRPRLWLWIVVTDKDRQTFNRYVGVVRCGVCGEVLNETIRLHLEEVSTVSTPVEPDPRPGDVPDPTQPDDE